MRIAWFALVWPGLLLNYFGQGGLLLKGHGHHLGWAFTSGRLAGRYASALPPTATATSQASTAVHA